jgi:HlyD family secretion protein
MRAQTLASFQRPAAIAKARAEAGIARDGLARQRDIARARLQQAQSAVMLAATRVAESEARIAGLDAAIAASTVVAQGPGLVMYRDVFFGSDRRKPQVGDAAAANQPLLAVPDTSKLTVETRVREIDVARIAAGRPALVRVDALPGAAAPATITLVGALALEDPARTGTRYFPVTVTLDRPDPRLRPGMTARVEIPAVTLPHAVVIPLQAVFDRDGERTCIVFDGGRWQRRAVTVAGVNETDAAIGAGLRAGDRVALVDPDAHR